MTKILMVCLGNICRSPLAEGILKNKVNPNTVFVDSAGTAGYHIGNAPDPRSIAVANKYGIDISKQVCRKFTVEDFNNFTTIFVMDNSNYNNVIALAQSPEHKNKVKLLLNFGDTKITEVPDPYYGGDQGFENVYNLIDQACTNIAKTLKNQ
ncbi:low molecular weight protein-tyrosine-phosphatase [Cellulophaga omnivescoria]|uniref:low molecular weight protein-tyrosine-phosphatase n=1 Tax=Cellulophaga omnivescoria TaxID=1888890 RepID=UPI0009850385|nr:low molecular weight protein-tyrosine-phosphatase [Cellulophaga omnivescoria]WBU89420.1 low molecular weight phosphotyrosine protein phosphatase [Cellulophaga omnivescoria]WKB81444.1 low molecular weight protein-tyrosine-phosphatase [Cellulophaga lytica]